MDDLRRQFEVNVFATVAVIRAVLPAMRGRRSGHILAVTSIGGMTTSPGLSFYHGSKFAMEGILASLGKEVAPLGIHVTAIEPGPFRTDWSGRSMVHSPRTVHDYDEFYEPIRAARAQYNGRQPGDPERAAQAVLRAIGAEEPPRHLLLGAASLEALAASRAALDQGRGPLGSRHAFDGLPSHRVTGCRERPRHGQHDAPGAGTRSGTRHAQGSRRLRSSQPPEPASISSRTTADAMDPGRRPPRTRTRAAAAGWRGC